MSKATGDTILKRTGYCKVVWSESKKKDGTLKEEVAVLPRDWVVKDSNVLFWPKQNSKSAIHNCLARPHGIEDKKKWYKFKLIWFGETCETFSEAGETETSHEKDEDDDAIQDDENPEVESENEEDEDDQPTKRKRAKSVKTLSSDFTGGSDLDVEKPRPQKTAGKRTENKPTRSISTELGDSSYSSSVLQSSQIIKGQVRTMAARKLLHSFQSTEASTSKDVIADTSSDEEQSGSSQKSSQKSCSRLSEDLGSDALSSVSLKKMLANLSADVKLLKEDTKKGFDQMKRDVANLRKDIHSGEMTSPHSEHCPSTEEDSSDMFCVHLPVYTFDDFDLLEDQLKEDKEKRKALRNLLISQGGKNGSDALKMAFPFVVGRPVLAEQFNCGGKSKSGSVLKDPEEKRNIMGTRTQIILEQVCRHAEQDMSPSKFKTYLSEFLKRSSQLKGGSHHKLKHAPVSSSTK